MLQGTDQERQKYKQQLELLENERKGLEKRRASLVQEIESYQQQLEKGKIVTAELQRQKEDIEDEKVHSITLFHYFLDVHNIFSRHVKTANFH